MHEFFEQEAFFFRIIICFYVFRRVAMMCRLKMAAARFLLRFLLRLLRLICGNSSIETIHVRGIRKRSSFVFVARRRRRPCQSALPASRRRRRLPRRHVSCFCEEKWSKKGENVRSEYVKVRLDALLNRRVLLHPATTIVTFRFYTSISISMGLCSMKLFNALARSRERRRAAEGVKQSFNSPLYYSS